MSVYDQTIFDLVDQITASASVRDVWKTFLREAGRVGLGFGYLSITYHGSNDPPLLLSQAMPGGWEKHYAENSLAAGDMLLARARASKQSFAWQLSDWARWCELNTAFGIRSGLCILDFHPGEESVLTLCGRSEPLSFHDRLALNFAGHEAIHCLQKFFEKKALAPIWVSQRERECLEWAAAGKTSWEIGQILSLSEKTVNVYITRAMSKLGVKSRTQAILKASKMGVISI